ASEECSERGFACDFSDVNQSGEPQLLPKGPTSALEIGLPGRPIPAKYRVRIALHPFPGFDEKDAPALVSCSARMEIHGAPMSRTWVDLGADVEAGAMSITLSETVEGWRVGDEVLITGSERQRRRRSYRDRRDDLSSETRRIAAIDGAKITLDRSAERAHRGHGEFRAEVANLSRNVVIESAKPDVSRGHTIYHRFSRGSISYAKFSKLGKEGVLGRYSIHFHVVGDTMRGSSVIGAAIVDSHNRWITVHGTDYLVVRDCVGYGSVGHGYFLEDGTETYNLLDRNLGVQAFRGRRLPGQVLPFDPNDGAAFWWSNGKNTLVRNATSENDEYGYRYDSQRRSNFDSRLAVRSPSGKDRIVDIRTIPIWRFEDNESHTEGLYSFALAGTEGTGPDTSHPHRLRGLRIWNTHYGLRAQLPKMLVEDVKIHRAAYGIYRPWFDHHVYRDLSISETNTEPFNRGLDDRSVQHGPIAVDGLTFSGIRYSSSMPLIQISANNPGGSATSHFRRVNVVSPKGRERALVNLGGGPRLEPETPSGVPIYVYDYFGAGRHAEVVSTRSPEFKRAEAAYRSVERLTGNESKARERRDVAFPKLLDPVDDEPPATIILSTKSVKGRVLVRGVSHDNGRIVRVEVNGTAAREISRAAGVVDWEIEIDTPPTGVVRAGAIDAAGQRELTPHVVQVLRRF
ncbi:MAG: hypothetical protein AAF517_21150, partial [Planctomycetota bacterium]